MARVAHEFDLSEHVIVWPYFDQVKLFLNHPIIGRYVSMNSILTRSRRNPYVVVVGNFADKLDVSEFFNILVENSPSILILVYEKNWKDTISKAPCSIRYIDQARDIMIKLDLRSVEPLRYDHIIWTNI